MKAKLLSASVAMALAMTATAASAVDFHGYFRSGVGVSKDGGTTEWNKNYVGRLGNEADTYGEIQLGQELYNKGGASFYVDSMIAVSSDGSNDWEDTSSSDADFALTQFNVQAKGLFSSNPGAVVWAGKRYYQRHDLHIVDYKYWNISGAGAGIENIQAGPGAFSLAWIRQDTNNASGSEGALNNNFLDIRYAGFKPWEGAWTEFGVSYALKNATDAQDDAGTYDDMKDSLMATAEISQYFASTGINEKFVVQFANNALAHNVIDQGGGWIDAWSGDNSSAKGWRFINNGELPFDKFVLNYVLTYGHAEDYGDYIDKTDMFSLVGRAQYQWTDLMKTIFEAGTFTKDTDYTSGSSWKDAGQKYTLAQAWSAGPGFWARPELRVYATYLKDGGDGDNLSFNSSADDNTWNFGVQAEAWW
ncbi:maltoporin [Pseudaeromonas sp. ZJS20]|uniref:maltoporin n=1 Tax=Pseudaeromonas aegiceratis TaxID=3153928 RepID=UPI00390C88DA